MAQGPMMKGAKKLRSGMKTGIQPTNKAGFSGKTDTNNKSKNGKLK